MKLSTKLRQLQFRAATEMQKLGIFQSHISIIFSLRRNETCSECSMKKENLRQNIMETYEKGSLAS